MLYQLQLVVAAGLVVVGVWATRSTLAVQLAGDWVRHIGQLLLLLLKVLSRCGGSVLVEPVSGLLNGIKNLGMS